MNRAELQMQVDDYLEIFPGDKSRLKPLLDQLTADEQLNDRRNFRGHITGAGIVLLPDWQKLLMIYHKIGGEWRQPGGHAESADASPLDTARREVTEETGVQLAEVLPIAGKLVPVEIHVHRIPAHSPKCEPEHYHYDFRYAFIAGREQLVPTDDSGVSAAKWFPLDAPETTILTEALHRLYDAGLGLIRD